MLLGEKTLEILTDIVAQHLPLALVGLVLVVGAVDRLCEVHTASTWVVRKGACPCCGSALFGTTAVYQHFPGLDRVCPESPYLCLTCDHAKVAAVQQHYHADGVEE
jgi:hypothetical protein